MTQPDIQAQFAAFLEFQKMQAAAAAVTPAEEVKPTIVDVFRALIRSARLPDERTVQLYESVVEDYFTAETEAEPTPVAATSTIPGTATIPLTTPELVG